MDQRDDVARIRAPTLVIAGTHDAATPPADGRFLAERIAGARYVELRRRASVQRRGRAAFTQALVDFSPPERSDTMDDRERYDKE